MEFEEVKNKITQAKNISIIPSQNESESIACALALFFTLKELGKNVNLVIDSFPENLKFLLPSLDFISYPKNLVISIPKDLADVSQIYYEKSEENVKIHLTLDKGNVKKENIAFYYSETPPDVLITLGIKDFQNLLNDKLDSFGFLLNTPIVNIDNSQNNKIFGKYNLTSEKSLSEIVLDLAKQFGDIKKETANCLLTGLVSHYDNFKNQNTPAEVFETTAFLIKQGASHQQIISNIYKTDLQNNFLGQIFQNLNFDSNHKIFTSILNSSDFQNFGETEAGTAVEKISSLGIQNDLLVLWQSHNSPTITKGFIFSKNQELINKVSQTPKNNWAFLSISEQDLEKAKETILNIL